MTRLPGTGLRQVVPSRYSQAHDQVLVRMTENVSAKHGAALKTEGICRDRGAFVVTGVGDSHVVTPIMVLRQGRIGCRATLGHDLDFWVATGMAALGISLGSRPEIWGRDLKFGSRQGPSVGEGKSLSQPGF